MPTIRVIQGDITKQAVEAIVNVANTSLLGGYWRVATVGRWKLRLMPSPTSASVFTAIQKIKPPK